VACGIARQHSTADFAPFVDGYQLIPIADDPAASCRGRVLCRARRKGPEPGATY